MALKGNLRDFTATQLLNLINLARKTGTLTVQGSETAFISFRDGKMIYAETGDMSGSLTQILQRTGKLTANQSRYLETNFKSTSDKRLGTMLVQNKLVTQNDIIQSIRKHALEIVFKLFSWVEGAFRFDANKLPSNNRITIPIDLESVILEGSRRLQESEQLKEEVPNLDATLRFVDRPDAKLRNVNMTVEEWRVVSYVNPKNSIRQIAKANSLTDFQIRRTVYGLVQAGIVELVQPERPAKVEEIERPRRSAQPQATVAERRSVVNRLINRIRGL